MDFSFDEHLVLSEEEAERRNQEGGSENENAGGEDDQSGTSKEPPKKAKIRVVRNPQPKLNPERLCGNRGIATLPKIFEDVQLKGKGHEKEDLDKVLKTLEHWSHRLFPKFSFDDALDRIQKLGTKKPVQSCLNKIRLDMISTWENEVVDDDELDPEDEMRAETGTTGVGTAVDDRFDRLHASLFGEPSTSHSSNEVFSTSQITENVTDNTVSPTTTTIPVLTDEQRAKMEENRRLATEKLRAARLRAIDSRNGPTDNGKPMDLHQTNSTANPAVVEPEPNLAAGLMTEGIDSAASTAVSKCDIVSEDDILPMMEVDFETTAKDNRESSVPVDAPSADSETQILVS